MSVESQFQIRNNALEASSALGDLEQWAKSTERRTRQGGPGAKTKKRKEKTAATPGVRGRAAVRPAAAPADPAAAGLDPRLRGGAASTSAPAKPPPPEGQEGRQRHAAGHTYDYFRDKWDKFDVDKALAEADADGPPPAAAPAPPEPTPTPAPRGDPSPAGGVRPAARGKTAAQLKDEGNQLFKRGKHAEAIEQYTASLEIEPTHLAFANRAMARLKLGSFAEAEADCTAALALEPEYVKAYSRRGTARRQQGRPLPAALDFEAALRLEPTSKALRDERLTCLALVQTQEKLLPLSARHVIPVEEDGPEPPGAEAPAPKAAPAKGSPPPPKEKGSPPPKKGEASPPKMKKASSPKVKVPVVQQALVAPRTGTDFELAWKGCKGDAARRAELVALVDAAAVPTIFKSSLTAPLLLDVLHVVLERLVGTAARGELGLDLLRGFARVPRFDMTVMCFPAKSKPALRAAWDGARERLAGDAAAQAALDGLRGAYRLK